MIEQIVEETFEGLIVLVCLLVGCIVLCVGSLFGAVLFQSIFHKSLEDWKIFAFGFPTFIIFVGIILVILFGLGSLI